MEISYKTKKLQKQLTDPKALVKKYGQMAQKINQRLKELAGADHLGFMKTLPAARCHELSGDRKGELAVDVSGNSRMLFQPDHDPLPINPQGGLNWEAVIKIRINEIKDYH